TGETGNGICDEEQTGEIHSPAFDIDFQCLSFLIGGGVDSAYIALCDRDGNELMRAIGKNKEAMERIIWDISKYKGKKGFLKVVDFGTGGRQVGLKCLGHINIDDIKPLSVAEEKEWRKKEAEKSEKQVTAKNKRLNQISFEKGNRMIYKGAYLSKVNMPLGGIGSGSIWLSGKSTLSVWQIFNNLSKVRNANTFFAIKTSANNKSVLKVLQTEPVKNFTTVQSLEFCGEYPFARLKYHTPDIPCKISLEAFNPMIPLDTKNSALPCAIFNFKIKNISKAPLDLSFILACRNPLGDAGWDAFKTFGENVNQFIKQDDLCIVNMRKKPDAIIKELPCYGDFTLATLNKNAKYILDWNNINDLTSILAKNEIPDKPTSSEVKNKIRNSALVTTHKLAPDEEKIITFFITWYFPNRHLKRWVSPVGTPCPLKIGNMYNNWFKNSIEVAEYIKNNFTYLYEKTLLYHDALYSCCMPYWFIDALSSNSCILRSQTVFWSQDNFVGGWEGCYGSCYGNCTHVWNYAQTHARLFPEIGKNMRISEFNSERKDGMIPYRLKYPFDTTGGKAIDGQCAVIANNYREYLTSSDRVFLDTWWEKIKNAVEFLIRTIDADEDGVPGGLQHNTYDSSVSGATTFIGSQYLCALAAAGRMAVTEHDNTAQKRYELILDKGIKNQDALLWNGEYYIQKSNINRKGHDYDGGCLSDQLLGQWWAHQLNLGYLYPKSHIKSALKAVFKYNLHDFTETSHKQFPRKFIRNGYAGLRNCTWPGGNRPVPCIDYADEAGWTGVEYAVAALMIYEGLLREGFSLVRVARERYDGKAQNPFSEIECGSFYARAMSSWSLLLACQGYIYEGPKKILGFKPKFRPEDHTSFFITAKGWGTFAQKRTNKSQTEKIELKYGILDISELLFQIPSNIQKVKVKIKTNRKEIKNLMTINGSELRINLPEAINLSEGDNLDIIITWE
ncbi:MAG: GH116 family glycosyl hydrolase, partial [Victivallaceae bacterium]|nr:GH116 family glycosyl hydrolase [Victivallaceae bacterium]